MRIISHRGNVRGRVPGRENAPSYIDCALGNGYDVEIDVWYKNDKLYLGHDAPEHEVDLDYLNNKKF